MEFFGGIKKFQYIMLVDVERCTQSLSGGSLMNNKDCFPG